MLSPEATASLLYALDMHMRNLECQSINQGLRTAMKSAPNNFNNSDSRMLSAQRSICTIYARHTMICDVACNPFCCFVKYAAAVLPAEVRTIFKKTAVHNNTVAFSDAH
eukprot:6194498-Pleurochrysis_carterae.AAC.3